MSLLLFIIADEMYRLRADIVYCYQRKKGASEANSQVPTIQWWKPIFLIFARQSEAPNLISAALSFATHYAVDMFAVWIVFADDDQFSSDESWRKISIIPIDPTEGKRWNS